MHEKKEIKGGPTRNPEVMWSKIGDRILIFYPEEYVIAELNPTAAFIWALCDGYSDLNSIVSSLCAKFNISPKTAKTDFYELIEKMKAMKLVNIEYIE